MRIALFHASAGHGHAKAAAAVKEGFMALGVPGSEIFLEDTLDETPAWFRKLYISFYYFSVKYTPRVWGNVYATSNNDKLYRNLAYPVRKILNSWIAKNLVLRMVRDKPEAIVSTHFLAPEVLGRAKLKGLIDSKLFTIVTDFIPHRFWINPGTNHYWVMSEEGKRNLEARGVSSEQVIVGGIPISLKFRPENRKKEIRKKEGLDETTFTILITSGSFGLGPTEEILEAMRPFENNFQVIVVCGKNEAQYHSLERRRYPFRLRLYGFVSHMHELMEASDLLIAKPGGATTSESLAKGVPMIVLEPIPGQETDNARLLKDRNASFFLHKPEDIHVILKGILDYPEVLIEKKRSIEKLAKPDAALDLAKFVLSQIGQKKGLR